MFGDRSSTTDYFVFGARRNAPYEGVLLCLQPWTYFVQMRRVKKRSSRTFRTAFADMRKVFERRFGSVDFILGDQDTAFEKDFQRFLDELSIGRFHDRTAFKISQVER